LNFYFFHKHSFQLKSVSDCVAATLRFGMSQPDGWMILEVFSRTRDMEQCLYADLFRTARRDVEQQAKQFE